MAPGMIGRLGERLHLKSSPTKNKASFSGRAPTPSIKSPRTRSPRKHLNFGRSAFSKPGNPFKSSKNLAPEPSPNDIFSSPLRPQVDNTGKPGCVRYISTYECGHDVTVQQPCAEHDPAFCLDAGHCMTVDMKKAKKCAECEKVGLSKMLEETASVSTDRLVPRVPPILPKAPPKAVLRASPNARAIIRARIEKRIQELGPLGEVRSSSGIHNVSEATVDFSKNVSGAPPLVSDFHATITKAVLIASGPINDDVGRSRADISAAQNQGTLLREDESLSYRAVSDSRLLNPVRTEARSVSASMRPLPPLPKQVNSDATANADDAHNEIINDPIAAHSANCGASQTVGSYQENKAHKTEDVNFNTAGSKPGEFVSAGASTGTGKDLLPRGHVANMNDPFVDRQGSSILTELTNCSDRPLPPVPCKLKGKRVPSSGAVAKPLFAISKSFERLPPGDEPAARSSPTPLRQAPAPPFASNPLADFDFSLEYSRGESGYTGRMGQKGSGEDFSKDWKLEQPARDYSKDETSTGGLWENKHGFGYAGLKRHLDKLKVTRKVAKKQNSPAKKDGKESINYSSPRPNKDSSLWNRRWAGNARRPLPLAAVQSPATAGKTNLSAILKMPSGETQVILKHAKREKYEGTPWDRTMIGCAL